MVFHNALNDCVEAGAAWELATAAIQNGSLVSLNDALCWAQDSGSDLTQAPWAALVQRKLEWALIESEYGDGALLNVDRQMVKNLLADNGVFASDETIVARLNNAKIFRKSSRFKAEMYHLSAGDVPVYS